MRQQRMREHRNYESGKGCEFRADGKLRGGIILGDEGSEWLIGYYGPSYREIILSKSVVKLHQK